MFYSTVIPTIGRDSLSRAVTSVLEQDYCDGEIIVVNDSGVPLSEAVWTSHERVTILNTNRRNRSVARNAGAAVARGKYLHFLDDDDWVVPGALAALRKIASGSEAKWVHGGFNLVNDAGELLATILPEEHGNCAMKLLASEWLPLQVSLIEAKTFFELGGFAPLGSLLGGYEDIDLSRQLSCKHDFARCDSVVANIRVGDQSSTTDYQNFINQNRQSREKQLSHPNCFSRLIDSIRTLSDDRPYWHGQLVYYLMASIKWNLQHKRLMPAINRTLQMIAGYYHANISLFTRSFWRGAMQMHRNRVRSVIEANHLELYTETEWRS